MSKFFCLAVRFLQPEFHGRGDQTEPEWPPSPLRIFQALTASASAREGRGPITVAEPTLRWLERQPPPTIVAPKAMPAQTKCLLYVPDNSSDLTAKSWARGNTSEITSRTEKVVCPVRLPENSDLHYLWPIVDDDRSVEQAKEALIATARSVTHLGWGVDMVAADASIITEADAEALTGERWRPTDDASATRLRVPRPGTLKALVDKHEAFLQRIGPDGFHPVPPLTTFNVVNYHRAIDPPRFPYAAFSLLKPDAGGFRAFDTIRRLKAVAGMLRHASRRAAERAGWSSERIDAWILGHGEKHGEPHRPVSGPRLAYVPLPSIQYRKDANVNIVTEIRRVLLMQFGGSADADGFHRLTRLLSGEVLIPLPPTDVHLANSQFDSNVEWSLPDPPNPGEPIAMLSRLPDSDKAVRRYIDKSSTWATVTPMLLPGYDDPRHYRRRLATSELNADERKRLLNKLDERIESLIRSSIEHAGYSAELARHADIEWCGSGFWPGTELASRYLVPNKLARFPRLHVRINWRDPAGQPIEITGPICLGGGRYSGFGLFARQ